MKKDKEIQTVRFMIAKFCSDKHHHNGGLCEECHELFEYAQSRIKHCHHASTNGKKPFCSNCNIHCYKPQMREKIRIVMRYSGPRMITSHPLLALLHVSELIKAKYLSKIKPQKIKKYFTQKQV